MQNKIESSLDLAYDTDTSNIIITGDFNYNYLNTAGQRKVTSLFEPYGLVQLIDEPTHYTEFSESIFDLLLTRNASSLLLCGVGDAFLDHNIRYHCPIYAIFNFDKHKLLFYKRNIWQYDNGNYDLLKQYVNEFIWLSFKSDNFNIYAENVTSKILEFCKRTILNKTITVRLLDLPWINNEIRKIIRKRKRAHKHAKKVNTPNNWKNLENLETKVSLPLGKQKRIIKLNFQKK